MVELEAVPGVVAVVAFVVVEQHMRRTVSEVVGPTDFACLKLVVVAVEVVVAAVAAVE